jgi:hypothetical protein
MCVRARFSMCVCAFVSVEIYWYSVYVRTTEHVHELPHSPLRLRLAYLCASVRLLHTMGRMQPRVRKNMRQGS